jgi:Kae1-associated kinase Bud32
MEKIIAQGAEALLIRKDNQIIKKRISKGYRHPLLDNQLRVRRTRSEGKILSKINSLISTPGILKIDEENKQIVMEFIQGEVLSNSLDNFEIPKAISICRLIGENIAIIHNAGIIHNDLTTSNMIFCNEKVYFIDFGLAFHSLRIEDKAVDLHLLRQAFESKHFKRWQDYFNEVIESYKTKSADSIKVLQQLKKVEARGRYKGKH